MKKRIQVGLLGAQAIVQMPNTLANLIHQGDRVQRCSAGMRTHTASQFQEDFMPSLSRSVQNIPQVLRHTLR